VANSTQPEAGPGGSVYEAAVEAAGLLSSAADPNRMAILTILAGGKTCVCTLHAHIPVAPNVLSYHLKVLREAGLIVRRRRGRWVDYELVGDALVRLRAALPVPSGEGVGRSP
jgi:ArsR family transcriptional regulator